MALSAPAGRPASNHSEASAMRYTTTPTATCVSSAGASASELPDSEGSGIDRTAQPYWIDTPAGEILEMPDTGGLADQATAAEMVEHVQWAAAELRRNRGRQVFVHLGFHAETADLFAPRLAEALRELEKRGIPLLFETVSEAAAAAQTARRPR